MRQAVVIGPYDKKSKFYFEKERKYLLKNLSRFSKVADIIHFGSSAVQGLGGKNVIDIFLVLDKKKCLNGLLDELEKNTTYIRWHGGDKGRIFLLRKREIGQEIITFHLHVTWKRTSKYKNALVFRDYLASHPGEAKKYFRLKKLWAKKAGSMPRRYLEMKAGYISKVVQKAKKKPFIDGKNTKEFFFAFLIL